MQAQKGRNSSSLTPGPNHQKLLFNDRSNYYRPGPLRLVMMILIQPDFIAQADFVIITKN
jgi:hypothetical protein